MVNYKDKYMFSLDDFVIKNDKGDLLSLDTFIKSDLQCSVYHVTDSEGFSVCSIYVCQEDDCFKYSNTDTSKACFVVKEIFNLIVDAEYYQQSLKDI